MSQRKRRPPAAPSNISPDHTVPAIRWRAAVIALLCAITYAGTLPAPFLPDDDTAITKNDRIREVWPLSESLSPPADTPVAGRPLVNLSFALNYAAHGLDVRGYHAVNVALHIAAALFLFGLVRRTLALPRVVEWFGEPDKARPTNPVNVAWICALVWALHPLNSEAVAYVSQRTELMMATAFLATLYFNARGLTAAAVAACAIGMACKESMVTAPLLVMIYDRVFRFESWREAFRLRAPLYGSLAATWLVLAALLAQQPRTSVGLDAGVSAWTYLLNQCRVIPHYLRLAIWPDALVWDYGLPTPLTLRDAWPGLILLLGLAALTIVLLIRQPLAGFLLLWCFITLGPTSSIVPIATEVGAERRMYLPMAGLVTLAVLSAATMSRKVDVTIRRAIAGAICLTLALVSAARGAAYQDLRTLAQTTVDRWPNGRGYFHLASELYDDGERDRAIEYFQLSARDFPGARYALGVEAAGRGDLAGAYAELDAFVRAAPNHINANAARDLLGRLLLNQGRMDEAIALFDLVLKDENYPARDDVVRFRAMAEAQRGRR